MAENKKQDKDSYAKDTMAFTVPNDNRKKRPQQRNINNANKPRLQNARPNNIYGPPNELGQYPNEYGYYPDQYGHYPNQYGQYPYPDGRFPAPNTQRQPQQRPVNSQRNNNQQHPNNRPPQRVQKNTVQNRPTSSRSNAANKKVVKPKKKKSCLSRIFVTIISAAAILFTIYSILALTFIGKMNIVDTDKRAYTSSSIMSSSKTRNVLLIGTDSRSTTERGRSDSMILLSICKNTKKINMISLMRDMYVDIPGYGGNKLNAAYSYGGPELLMDTIEKNLNIEINDYMTVNFTSFSDIVNAVGGVEIEVSDKEATAINVLLKSKEGKKFFGEPKDSDFLDGAGTYNMSGKQALCYSRLRKVGNADFERTERQRKVLSGILKKAANPFKLGSIASSALPSITTNMNKGSLYMLSLRMPSLLIGYDVNQMRVPAEDTFTGATVDGQSVLQVDFETNINMLRDELYNK